jgi:DNA-directed RNA polymerase specialized sigma24 family protein
VKQPHDVEFWADLVQHAASLEPSIRASLHPSLRSRIGAEDIRQEALLSLFKAHRAGRIELRDRKQSRSLLHTFVVHATAKAVARELAQRRSVRREEDADAGSLLSRSADQSDVFSVLDVIEHLSRTVGGQTAAVALYRVAGFSIDEIASALTTSPRTVKGLLVRLRDVARQYWAVPRRKTASRSGGPSGQRRKRASRRLEASESVAHEGGARLSS